MKYLRRERVSKVQLLREIERRASFSGNKSQSENKWDQKNRLFDGNQLITSENPGPKR